MIRLPGAPSVDEAYGTVAPSMRTARQVLTGWAFQWPGWKDRATWSRVL